MRLTPKNAPRATRMWDIPQDIAVVGAGNVHYSDMLAIPLTTVDQGTVQIGKQAAQLLMEQIGAKNKSRVKKILITPKLVIRRSTQRSPAQHPSASPDRVEQKLRPAART